MLIADLKRTVALVGSFLQSMMCCCKYWAAPDSSVYSASAADSATHVCFLLFQLTAVPLIWNRYPEVTPYCICDIWSCPYSKLPTADR